MFDVTPLKPYLRKLRDKLATGDATEHTHRSSLEALIESLGDGIQAINEPKRIECGAPDLAVLHDGFMVGHIEAKDVGTPLDVTERSEQLKRYRQSLPNLILTDYLEFRWYAEGEHRRTVELGRLGADDKIKLDRAGKQNVAELLCDFLAHEPEPIATPRELAERMARLTHLIRDIIITAFEKGKASDLLRDWRQAFAEVLVAELDEPENVGQFADMFAQTLAYGLFSARIRHVAGDFTRQKAQYLIPKTNPFLRDFFVYITGPQLDDEPYAGLVEDLVQLLALAEMDEILADFGKRTRQEDPTVHFYETFLAAYDPELRDRRGVRYTPNPVVSYIVRSVDALLKDRFGLSGGLADTTRLADGTHKVLVLDPACGTATFLYSVIDLIREGFMTADNAGMWSDYVREHLLPRIFGFELLMAPYAVAHFKLALQLAGHDLSEAVQPNWTYDFAADERIQVYLTNTLEHAEHEVETLWGPLKVVAKEAQSASTIKDDLPIMVILGNPPYANFGQMNRNTWILGLLDEYKRGLDEKKLNIDDDYIKFIRWGQWRIDETGQGILAFITNHTYLDGITHRQMRNSLKQTFDEIYVLNLHGNVRRGETCPDGSPDENVFDIQQGVAISIFIKNSQGSEETKVYHSDLWGTRDYKYEQLLCWDVTSTPWEQMTDLSRSTCLGTSHFFVPKGFSRVDEYCDGWSVQDGFPVNQSGIKTDRDDLFFAFKRDELEIRMKTFYSAQGTEAPFKNAYRVYSTSSYPLLKRREQTAFDPNSIEECVYRPFDERHIYYSPGLTSRPAWDVTRHLLAGENLALLAKRQNKREPFSYVLCTDKIAESAAFESAYANNNVFPLYLYPDEEGIDRRLMDDALMSHWPPDPDHGNRVPNLNQAFVEDFEDKLGLAFDPHKTDNAPSAPFGPRDVLAYIYAIFHSPTYRERYAEFLKIDFPRVPITSDPDLFWDLVGLGSELIDLHLMDHPKLSEPITSFPVPGDDRVKPRGGFPKFIPAGESRTKTGEVAEENRVYINLKQYFKGVPKDAWEFQVGGYQVLHKWLKDRKGRKLSYEDKVHWQRIAVALKETIRLMDEIDETIPGWPIE